MSAERLKNLKILSANIFSRTQDLIRAVASDVTNVHAYPVSTPPSSSFTFSSAKKTGLSGLPNLVERNLCLNKSTKHVTRCFFPTEEVGENYKADTEAKLLSDEEIFPGSSNGQI